MVKVVWMLKRISKQSTAKIARLQAGSSGGWLKRLWGDQETLKKTIKKTPE